MNPSTVWDLGRCPGHSEKTQIQPFLTRPVEQSAPISLDNFGITSLSVPLGFWRLLGFKPRLFPSR